MHSQTSIPNGNVCQTFVLTLSFPRIIESACLKVSFVRVLFLRVLLHIYMYKYICIYEFPCLILFMSESFICESFVSESLTSYIHV